MRRRTGAPQQLEQPLLAPPPTTRAPEPNASQPAAHSIMAAPGVPPGEDGRLVLSIPEAYQALGIGETTLRQLIASGRLPVLRLGRRVLIPRSAVEALVGQAAAGRPGAEPWPERAGR